MPFFPDLLQSSITSTGGTAVAHPVAEGGWMCGRGRCRGSVQLRCRVADFAVPRIAHQTSQVGRYEGRAKVAVVRVVPVSQGFWLCEGMPRLARRTAVREARN